jgi:hypothetical protein
MYDAWYQRLDQNFFERIGLGLWRIEVEPAAKQQDDLFLHVLWATDASATEMLPTELVEEDGRVGARIRTPQGEVTVTFAATGPVAAHLSIQGARPQAGASARLDTDLATDVRDDYEAWRDDPRYQRWMSDPAMQPALQPMSRRG